MKTSSKPATAKKWTTAKRFKVIGSALLLIAFGTQMYQTKAATRESVKTQANQLDGRQHMKALEYTNLYFAEKAATGKEDPARLNDAAMEFAVGRIAMVTVSDVPHAEKVERIHKITDAAKNVNDLDGFNAFVRVLTSELDKANSSELDAYIKVANFADRLWWVYIFVYAAGSLCLLRSQYLE
jgi:hypothetical protein